MADGGWQIADGKPLMSDSHPAICYLPSALFALRHPPSAICHPTSASHVALLPTTATNIVGPAMNENRAMSNIRTILSCLVSLWLLAVSPAGGASQKMAIGYTAITGIKAGLWVAEEARIFEKYGIDPSIILITTASKMAQAMMAGDVPFAGAGGIAAVSATLAGGDFVMVGALAKVPRFLHHGAARN